MAWRCRFLTARRSQDGRVVAEHPTHQLISTQTLTGVRHAEQPRPGMLEVEGLVLELAAIDGLATRAVVLAEVACARTLV